MYLNREPYYHFMMKRYLLLIISLTVAAALYAQSWSEIKAKKNIYLSGEGRGESIEEADERALADLISQISIAVTKESKTAENETISTTGVTVSSDFSSVVKSYSSATLTNTERLIIQDEPEAIVGRYIRRSEIEKIFEGRRNKVKEYVALALESEKKTALDNSLRYLYWASILLNTLPNPNDAEYTTEDGNKHILSSWIPAQMDNILDGIKVKMTKHEGNDVDLFFSYNGKPISSVDYSYFDGRDWSSIYSAKDGRGVLELMPGATTDNVKLRFEYRYVGQAKLIDKEVASALAVAKGQSRKKATYTITKSDNETSTAEEISYQVKLPVLGEVLPTQKQVCKTTLDRVVSAIRSKNYQSVQSSFTPDGYEIFLKLMQYGNARVLEQRELTYSKLDQQIIVRSVPMSFQFKNGAVKSFVEEVVFTMNPDGKIDNITFGLGDQATIDIMSQPLWKEEARIMLVNFLEVYKTAFALKRLDYIESVFDDNAVIITGRVVMRRNNSDADKYAQNRYVIRTQYTKAEYLNHLRASFASKEFINIRFAKTYVKKSNGQEIYGIQLKQDYYSSNYGDSGYLYLQVDMTNPNEPIIKVRIWHDQIDPTVGRPYGMEDF